ncbi:hypothetical protein PanWU01x14_364350 [Parasponia andersonii]|uniref:Uncharacterized protein n=1 Tax=Parasponia andersonii TaxID=3476 RepID=A0A2P5A6B8_PARAD|nr:hypothetical protein PanWU01x14_364350 [Parasponia andersonii]
MEPTQDHVTHTNNPLHSVLRTLPPSPHSHGPTESRSFIQDKHTQQQPNPPLVFHHVSSTDHTDGAAINTNSWPFS